VLVEKPMAMTASDCRKMIEAAKAGNTVIAVGLVRRFLHSALFTKQAIESDLLGSIESFDFREGNVYNWPVSSDFFFRRETAGGGVLFDTGAHTLDLLLWWLGDMEVMEYLDDGFGGVEADCEIRLKATSGALGVVELSRTRDLRNMARIKGERGELEVNLRKNEVSLTTNNGAASVAGHGLVQGQPDMHEQGFFDLFPLQLGDFVNAIQSGKRPRACGEEAARSIALIESCYQKRAPLGSSWISLKKTENVALEGKRILVTGATGFIGGRLVERLFLEKGARIRTLVRDFKNASRLARFPVEMIGGDISNGEMVANAMEGCEVVFHCAYDFSGSTEQKEKVSVNGTENVCRAALKHGIKRLVHVSTISVYGTPPEGDLDEDYPKRATEDVYATTKLAAEELVLDFYARHGLPVAVLQPTIVYGPFSRPWTINPIKQMAEGLVVLPNGGDGICNAVYIDDVVDAMFLAAVKDEALGEVFLISASKPVLWKEFYGALEGVLGRTATIYLTNKKLRELQEKRFGSLVAGPKHGSMREVLTVLRDQTLWERIYNIPGIKTKAESFKHRHPKVYDFAITKILGANRHDPSENERSVEPENTQNIHVPDKTRHELLSSRTRVRIDKARKLLGYEPKYDFATGMSVTAEFLRWANYCD
jgi:nucleoside-diphosphate-sugar epimerase